MPDPPVVNGKKVKRDYEKFEKAAYLDTPIEPVCAIYRTMVADPDTIVILLTGRTDGIKDDTEQALENHDLSGYDELFMKPKSQQHTPDVAIKKFLAGHIQKKYGLPISMVFEDRGRVVNMWREMGIFVFDVNQEHTV